jgi:hypothetical protein
MSLKAFHIVFVAASILLAFGFGAWSLLSYKDEGRGLDLVLGISSVAAGIGLIAYAKAILRKLKHISYL